MASKSFKAKIVVNATVEIEIPADHHGRVMPIDKAYTIDEIMDIVYDEADVDWKNIHIIGYQ